MASLQRIVIKLKEKKFEAAKQRRKSEKQLKAAKALKRRAVSGLVSVQRRIDYGHDELSDISSVLTQKTAQKESIERLVIAAQEKLGREEEAKTQAEQEMEFADTADAKQNAEARLRIIVDHIAELKNEIKAREKTAKRLVDEIDQYQTSKSKISSKVQKQARLKPELKKELKKGEKDSEKLSKTLAIKSKREDSVAKSLQKVSAKLQELSKNKKKTKKKHKLKQKTKKKSASKKTTKRSKPKSKHKSVKHKKSKSRR